VWGGRRQAAGKIMGVARQTGLINVATINGGSRARAPGQKLSFPIGTLPVRQGYAAPTARNSLAMERSSGNPVRYTGSCTWRGAGILRIGKESTACSHICEQLSTSYSLTRGIFRHSSPTRRVFFEGSRCRQRSGERYSACLGVSRAPPRQALCSSIQPGYGPSSRPV